MKKYSIFLLILALLTGCVRQEASTGSAAKNAAAAQQTEKISQSASQPQQEASVTLSLGVQGDEIAPGEYEENNFYKDTISDFQETYPESLIETRVYPADDTGLLLELTAGTGPDLILTGSFDNAGPLTGVGALVDLYPWLDEDADLSRDAFMNLSLLEIDGKLTRVSPQYYITTYYGTQDAYGEEMGWTLDVCLARIADAQRPEDILGNITGSSFVATMIASYASKYVNYEDATCTFDTEEFRTILDIAASIQRTGDDPDVYTEDTQTTQEFFTAYPEVVYPCRIAGVSEFTTFLNTTAGISVNFMSMPSQEGNGAQAAFLQPLSVCSFTDHPEECWQFVKYFLINDNVLEDTSYFPVYLPYLQQQIQNALVDSVDRREESSQSLMIAAAINGSITPEFTASEAKLLWYLLSENPSLYGYDPVVSPVVLEELEGYLSGNTPQDQVISIIESRLKIYLSEIQRLDS